MTNDRTPKIFYTHPSITELEVEYATDAAANGWGEHCYDYINRFESKFALHLGSKYAIATSSCTGALHMGMYAMGIGPGDEVILANTNWIATAAPIVHLGATPVLVDILPDSWCLDPQQVESAITDKTKAIVAVHLYGNLCDMNTLLIIGERYGIPVIEDAAEAIGSVYHGKKAGCMGIFGAFSFHGTKTITTGEGGMLVTNDEKLYECILTLSNHGRSKTQSKKFWPDMIGFKYKMSNIQAAIGCAQIERVNELIEKKRIIFNEYKEFLHDLPISMNPEQNGCSNGYWMPTFVVDKTLSFNRNFLSEHLASESIDARFIFWPLSFIIETAKKIPDHPHLAESIHMRGLNLPSPFGISKDQIRRVSRIITTYFRSIE